MATLSNTVSELTGPRFEPQTPRSRDERVTAQPTGLFITNVIVVYRCEDLCVDYLT